jgi:hypothetical protein
MARHSFRTEQMFAAMFAAAASGLWWGLDTMSKTPRRRQFESHEEWRAAMERTTDLGVFVAGASGVSMVLLLAAGLMIAFGVGPSFLARYWVGVRVEERLLLYPDGTVHYNRGALSDCDVRHYLRIRLPDGSATEVQCKEEVYDALRIGAVGNARILGRRLLSFVRTESGPGGI